MKKNIVIIAVISLLCLFTELSGQKIFIDQPVSAGDLTLFPSVDNPNIYYYMPSTVRLGMKDGKPQMSFMKFADNVRSEAEDEDVREAKGGGLFHAAFTFESTDNEKAAAQKALEELNPEGKIIGPVIYKSGTVALISAVANKDGDNVQRIVGLGKAPLIEGHKAAIAFMLDKEGAKILWNTFQTPTPDISFSFEMEIAGYLSPVKGWIKGNFDQIYESHEFSVEAAFSYPPYVGIGLEASGLIDKMIRKGMIEVYQEGSDKSFDALMTIAYNKIADLLFEPMNKSYSELTKGPSAGTQLANNALSRLSGDKSLLDKLTSDVNKDKKGAEKKEKETEKKKTDKKGKSEFPGFFGAQNILLAGPPMLKDYILPPAEQSKPMGFSLTGSYRYRKTKMKGDFFINLNKVSKEESFFRFDENIGDVKKQCPECFTEVNLYDPQFVQREILVLIDGNNVDDFSKYINFVSVQLKKEHDNGHITFDELRIDQKNFVSHNNRFKLLYGWDNDQNRDQWLNYQIKTQWNFFGNYEVENDWVDLSANGIALGPPVESRTVQIEADPDLMKENNIRMILVKIYYDYGTGEKVKQLMIKSGKVLGDKIAFILPNNQYEYEYEVMWHLWDNERIFSERKKTSLPLVFVDALPKKEN